MSLKYRHLQVFDALIKAGSVSGAAARLNVTQPAVSVALSDLEKRVGFRLFERSKGYFAPTRDAQIFYDEAVQGLAAVSRLERLAADIRNGNVGSITLVSNGAAAINLLPRLIAEFHEECPGIGIDLEVHSSRQCAAAVSSRQADIGLIDAPVPMAGLEAQIFNLPCVVAMRVDDPLTRYKVIRPQHLADQSVIAITGDHLIDKQLDGLMAALNKSVERRVSSSYFAIARNMVRRGIGVALVDCVNGRIELGDDVTWRRFEPGINFELAMIVAKEQELPDSVLGMIRRIEEALRAEINHQ